MPLDHSQLRALGLAPELALSPSPGPRVDIRLCHLSPQDSAWDTASSALSEEEALTASRFVFTEQRRRFVQGKRALRQILGKHLAIAAERVSLCRGLHGRPYVHNADPQLDFNMSHSGDWAVVAVSFDGWVGIDLEACGHAGWADLAATVLTPREQRHLASLPEPLRADRFIAYWTAKESFMKLNGVGLGIPPESIEVHDAGMAAAAGEMASALQHPSALAVEQAFLTRIVVTDALACTLATTAFPGEIKCSWLP